MRDTITAVAGAAVTGDAFADGTADFTAVSDADGKYAFEGVPNGDTKVTLTAPAGYETLFGGTVTVTVAGAAAVARDLGLAKPAVVSGTAFADFDGDGARDAGEPGLAGIWGGSQGFQGPHPFGRRRGRTPRRSLSRPGQRMANRCRRWSAKRIDTIATALHARMRVDELVDLDLAYAPPFGTTWDPIHIAARTLAEHLGG